MKETCKRLHSGIVAMAISANAAACMLAVPAVQVTAAEPLLFAEAEDCDLISGSQIATNVYGTEYPGYSGEGFVWVANGGGIQLNVDLAEGAMYEITTRCWMYLDGTRSQTVTVDGEQVANVPIPNKGEWIDFSFGYFYIPAGEHTIEISGAGSYYFVLYDTVTFDYADMPEMNVPATPSDPKATAETKALMQYMTAQYGDYIISGQQEIYGNGNNGDSELEFEYIFDATGQYPAIRGFDFMNYNNMYGWEDGTTGRIIQWVTQRGGIATACWHINVPKDFDNYTLGDFVDWEQCSYANYQKTGSTFNTEKVLTEGTKEREFFEANVALLAEQLLMLQEAGVPVIFRPLHEAQGNYGRYGDGTAWFWWGDRGPEVFKELWKLLYTLLTEKHGVHNCIWELNLYELDNSDEWYPGDAYVDMIAYDKYEGSPYTWNYDPATSVFLKLVGYSNDTKMVALAETDKIPSVEKMLNEGAMWSYFCPWYGSFLTDGTTNPTDHLHTVYNSDAVITLDELPSDLYGYERGNGGNWDVEGAYECEDGTITRNNGTAIIDYKYCSGTGYVFLQGEDDAIEQTVTVDEAGTYYLSYGYQQRYEKLGKTQMLYVNGAEQGEVFFPFSVMFRESESIPVELKAGTNTIKLVSVEGWTYYDYLLVSDTAKPVEPGTTEPPVSDDYKAGDVNCDNNVKIGDVILLNRFLSEDGDISISEQGIRNADANQDGKSNADDAVLILKWIAGVVD
ncbi:MAG: glycosyl hydrolase [Oscillospiraceae bacterium]|nr:glycosyl hydrolase [Oscillospiraceae bacterium]